jgi:hypothetical protein
MAWETRRGRGRFYTRSLRRGAKVVRIYVGTGPDAEAAAAEDAARRLARKAEFEARREEQARQKAMEAPLGELSLLTDLVLFAALILAGYHRSRRGPWRRKRHVHPA